MNSWFRLCHRTSFSCTNEATVFKSIKEFHMNWHHLGTRESLKLLKSLHAKKETEEATQDPKSEKRTFCFWSRKFKNSQTVSSWNCLDPVLLFCPCQRAQKESAGFRLWLKMSEDVSAQSQIFAFSWLHQLENVKTKFSTTVKQCKKLRFQFPEF